MQLPWNSFDDSLEFTLSKNERENSITASSFDVLPFEIDITDDLGLTINISNQRWV